MSEKEYVRRMFRFLEVVESQDLELEIQLLVPKLSLCDLAANFRLKFSIKLQEKVI